MKFLISLVTTIALFGATFAQDATIKTKPVYAYAGVPASGTSEIDTLTIQSSTTALVFTLTATGGRTTAPITWSATDATLIARIDAAVEALSLVGVGGVTTAAGSGSSGIGTYTLTFAGKNAKVNMPALTITVVSQTGGTAPTISTTTAGVDATFKDAEPGTLLVNTTTPTLYQNTSSTAGSPTWSAVTSAELATVLAAIPTVAVADLGAVTAAALTGTLTGTANGAVVDIAATAAATGGGATPANTDVDAGIATAVASIVSGTNEQLKELQVQINATIVDVASTRAKLNDALAKLRTAGLITP